MKAIKEYIFATMNNDVGVGGVKTLATGGIYYARPEGPTVDWSQPRVTYFLVDWPGPDRHGGFADQFYQIDVWSKNPDTNDSIAGRITALLDTEQGAAPWDVFHRRVDSAIKTGETELFEDDIQVHHKVLQLRVQSTTAI